MPLSRSVLEDTAGRCRCLDQSQRARLDAFAATIFSKGRLLQRHQRQHRRRNRSCDTGRGIRFLAIGPLLQGDAGQRR